MSARFKAAFACLAVLVLACSGSVLADDPVKDPITVATEKAESATVQADSAWMLVSTAMVLLMVPGLALFYGGMVRRKNVLCTMMHSMVCLGLVGIQWVLFGYSLAFGLSKDGLIGWDMKVIGLNGLLSTETFPGTNI